MSLQINEYRTIIAYISEQKLAIQHSIGWKNLMNSANAPGALVLDVADLASLQEIVRKIYELNQQKPPEQRILVRPAAGGRGQKYSQSHSVHGIGDADIIIRLTGEAFHSIEHVDKESLQVTVGGSIQVGELNKLLNKHYQLALPNASLSPYITVAGLAANSGIGTGQSEPSFSGLVRAFKICLPDGQVVDVDENSPYFETIQSAHQGLFGFVVGMTLQCRQTARLEQVRQLMSVADFCDKVQQGLFRNEQYVSVMLQPLYVSNETQDRSLRNVCTYIWRPVDNQTSKHKGFGLFSPRVQEAMTSIYDFTHAGYILSSIPKLIPAYTRNVLAPMSIGTRNSTSIMSWHKSVHHQTSFPHDIVDAGFLFEVSDNGQEIIEALRLIYEKINEYAALHKYPVLTGMYLRYLQGSNGGISTTAHAPDKHICSIDLVSSTSMQCTEDFLNEIWEILHHRFNARPHLGKWLPKGYHIDSSNFRDTLLQWYAHHGMSLASNMLLTKHYCDLYHLPAEIEPTPTASLTSEEINEEEVDLGIMGMSCSVM